MQFIFKSIILSLCICLFAPLLPSCGKIELTDDQTEKPDDEGGDDHNQPPTDNPDDYALNVCQPPDVADGTAERGVLVCGTGIGMAVAANKIDGIRAANVTSPLFAALAREHNDANVVSVSGRCVDESVNREILDAFVSTSFGGGRHACRVEKIAALENE